MGTAEAEQALTEWKRRADENAAERDALIRAAHAAGSSITRIRHLSGLSRTTVYKILGLGEGRAT